MGKHHLTPRRDVLRLGRIERQAGNLLNVRGRYIGEGCPAGTRAIVVCRRGLIADGRAGWWRRRLDVPGKEKRQQSQRASGFPEESV
jgi:hypothetical protein